MLDRSVHSEAVREPAIPPSHLLPATCELLCSTAVSSLKLVGKPVAYEKIAEEISAVKGVVTHGLMLDVASTAVIANGQEPRIIERVG